MACREETEQDPRVRDQEREEIWAEAVKAGQVGRAKLAGGSAQVRVVNASARSAENVCPIDKVFHV